MTCATQTLFDRVEVASEFIAAGINDHLENHHLLSNKQFVFLAGKSSLDLLLSFTNKWQQSLDASEETRVIAPDIAGALDAVWHDGILARLKSIGIEGELIAFLENYLMGRNLQVVLQHEESSAYRIVAGVTQGSLLEPLLWNILFDESLQLSPFAMAYADDLTLCISYTRDQLRDPAKKNCRTRLTTSVAG